MAVLSKSMYHTNNNTVNTNYVSYCIMRRIDIFMTLSLFTLDPF